MKKLLALILAVLTVATCIMLASCEKEPKKYTVSFDTMGGSEVLSQQVEENKTVAQPLDPTKAGYVFTYWYLEDESVPFDFSTYKVKSNITLKAYWQDVYTVSFKVGDQIIATQQVDVITNNGVTRPETNPTQENNVFAYWKMEGEDGPYEFGTKITKNITLKAIFLLDVSVEDGEVMFYYDDFIGKDYVTYLPFKVTANAGDKVSLPKINPTSSSNDEFYGWVNATTGEKYLISEYQGKDYSFTYDGKAVVFYAIGKIFVPEIIK